SHCTATTTGVRTSSSSTVSPNRASLSTTARRGRLVVFVTKQWGTPSRRSEATASAAPGTAASPTYSTPSRSSSTPRGRRSGTAPPSCRRPPPDGSAIPGRRDPPASYQVRVYHHPGTGLLAPAAVIPATRPLSPAIPGEPHHETLPARLPRARPSRDPADHCLLGRRPDPRRPARGRRGRRRPDSGADREPRRRGAVHRSRDQLRR